MSSEHDLDGEATDSEDEINPLNYPPVHLNEDSDNENCEEAETYKDD